MWFRPLKRSSGVASTLKRRMRKRHYLLILLGFGLLVASLGVPQLKEFKSIPEPTVFSDPRAVRGTLRFSAYKAGERNAKPLRHTSVFRNGPDYAGMEDNDLRGFLDGVFKNGWNQPGQVHVRLGRRADYPRYGEHELFRVLQRWADMELPPEAQIIDARLVLTVEKGPPFDVSVLLYEVKKDWAPGEGGIQHNNNSPPQKGEVWWNDVAYMEKSWGLPGAGFASDRHPEADTASMPLAEAHYRAGEQRLVFSSAKLAQYLSERISKRQPVLFLLKQSDYHEDRLASLMSVYSGNHGDNRDLQRRPHLDIEWESHTEFQSLEQDILLEYGRSYALPRQDINGATHVAVSVETTSGYAAPSIEIRGGNGKHVSAWRHISLPSSADWEWIEVRLAAVVDPVVMGEPFVAQLRDTWVRTAPPEEQEVLWTFVSPTGKKHKLAAAYQGAYRWQVNFQPEEIGRWHYYWTQNFLEQPYMSALGKFDVVAGDMERIRKQLLRLRDHMQDTTSLLSSNLAETFGAEFMKLERAALQLETPESFASKSNGGVYALLKEVRGLLWGKGKPVPEPVPLRALRREW